MNTPLMPHVTFEDFRVRSAGKKVVILYPWTNYRTLFLAHFVADSQSHLLYYRIQDGETTLTDWLRGMVEEFHRSLEVFGARVFQALADGARPGDLGAALAADLAECCQDQSVVLFVDEFDRLTFDQPLSDFVRAFTLALPEGAQLAVSARQLSYQPWYDVIARGDGVVLGTEYRADDVMFAVSPRPRPRLEVYALGRGHVLVNGRPITNWDGALPRNLFFFFMDRTLVTRDEIFATFWPELPIKEATNVFHVTKRKISERIGMKIEEPGSYELTRYSGGFYTPSDKLLRYYDVGEFQTAVEQALATTDDRQEEALLTRAVNLYRSPYLETVDMPWVVERREQLRLMSAQALINLGRLNKRRGDHQLALSFFLRALKEAPEREDIHREVINLYAGLGRMPDAIAHYQMLVKTLRDRLGINPARETQELFARLQSGG